LFQKLDATQKFNFSQHIDLWGGKTLQ